jgi:hypothetical protein
MGFWGWFIILGFTGLLFLRQRIAATLTRMADRSLNAVVSTCALCVVGYILTKFTLLLLNSSDIATPTPWLLDAAGAVLAWALILAISQSGKRTSAHAETLRQQRLQKGSSDTRRAVRESLSSALGKTPQPFTRADADLPEHPLPEPAGQPEGVTVHLGQQLFGEHWQKLLQRPDAPAQPPPAAEVAVESREELVRLLAQAQATAAQAQLALTAAQQTSDRPHTGTQPQILAQHQPPPQVQQSPVADDWRGGSKPAAGLATRAKGPVTLGSSTGPRPAGPVQLGRGGSSYAAGPVSLGGRSALLGQTEPPARPVFKYVPALVNPAWAVQSPPHHRCLPRRPCHRPVRRPWQ